MRLQLGPNCWDLDVRARNAGHLPASPPIPAIQHTPPAQKPLSGSTPALSSRHGIRDQAAGNLASGTEMLGILRPDLKRWPPASIRAHPSNSAHTSSAEVIPSADVPSSVAVLFSVT